MTYAPSTPYREIGNAPLPVWEAELARLGSPLADQVGAIVAAAQNDSALCLAMGVVENQWAATGHYIMPEHNNPLSLRPWEEDPRGLPPGAIDILTTPDTGDFLIFDHPVSCIREWRRRLFDDPDYKGGVYTRTTTLAEMLDTYAPPGDVHGGTGTDNADIRYAEKVAAILNRVLPSTDPDPEVPEPVAGMKQYTFPGLDVPVWLPDDIEVLIRIIPRSTPGWTSGIPSKAHTRTTWHDTGNPNSSAMGEYTWAAGGGRADIDSPGSYNGIFDKDRLIITQRFDELVGHAANDTGNRTSWAFEQAFGTGFDAGLRVGAAVHGGIIAAKGWNVDTALVQHRYWSGKWCPGQILNRGIWSQVVKMTSDAALRAKGAAVGGGIPTPPTYAAPAPIAALDAYAGKPDAEIPYRVAGDGWVAYAVFDRVAATRATPRRRYATGDERVGPDLPAGAEFDVDWLITGADFPDTYYTPWATRVTAGDTKRVSDVRAEAG